MAFHLDKLVDAGLLRAGYEAPPGQRRGRGRSPKVYEPAGDGVAITIPERRYLFIAEILAAAVDDDPGHADHAAARQAERRGNAFGTALVGEDRPDLPAALAQFGFEPERTPGRVLLHNCPFHALTTRHTTLVCGFN